MLYKIFSLIVLVFNMLSKLLILYLLSAYIIKLFSKKGVSKLESCWLIEFDNGQKVIISEEVYEIETKRNWLGRKRTIEAHWFIYSQCKQRNPGIQCVGNFKT